MDKSVLIARECLSFLIDNLDPEYPTTAIAIRCSRVLAELYEIVCEEAHTGLLTALKSDQECPCFKCDEGMPMAIKDAVDDEIENADDPDVYAIKTARAALLMIDRAIPIDDSTKHHIAVAVGEMLVALKQLYTQLQRNIEANITESVIKISHDQRAISREQRAESFAE